MVKGIADLRAEITSLDSELARDIRAVETLKSLGTTSLDRRISNTAPEQREPLQLERVRQGNEEAASKVSADLDKMIAEVARYSQAQQEAAAVVTKGYQEQVAALATYTVALERATALEREQLSAAASQFAPRVKSYQEVTEQIILEGVALQNLATTEREALATSAAQFAPKVKSYQEVTAQITAQMLALNELATAERTQLASDASKFAPKVKSYQEVTTLITAQMAALNELATAERAQLAGEAGKYAPRVKSYQEVTTAIRAQIAAMIELDRQEAKTFEDEMRASLKAADTEIEANNRVLQSFREKRALEADTAPQRAVMAQADVYDKYYAPAVNKASESSLGFVRSITGLVSASNLLGVSGNNAALNILTMSASFDRMGTAGLALGGAIGIVLAGVGSLISAYNTLRQGAENLVGGIVSVTESLIQQGAEGFASAVKSAADYQQQLAFIAGLLNPTAAEFDALNTKVENVAQTTVFGMGKATEAVSELARAGNSLTDIINKGALDAVVNLAQAANGELNLADAAKSVTSIVGAYTQVVDGALTQTVSFERATDALTGTAQLSRLSFLEVLQAWRQAAPIAASTKISVEDLGATIAILANASETGSISGTALKQVILDLEKPSKAATEELNRFGVSLFTSEGAIRPFRDVIIDMNRAFGEQALATGKVTEEEQKHALAVIFGSRAALAANILTNQGVEAFDRMRASMENVKTVDLANVMLLPLNARLEILQNIVGAASIALAGPFLGAISDVVNKGIELGRSIPLDTIRLFGQAIVAIATDEGFGMLQEKLATLASPEAFEFFVRLLNFARNVRSALVDEIVPAFIAVSGAILEFEKSSANISAIAGVFDKLDIGVHVFALGVVFAIEKVGEFVIALQTNQELINNIIHVVEGLAVVVGGTLVASFIAVAVPMGFVLQILGDIGQAFDPVIRAAMAMGGQYLDAASAIAEANRIIQESTAEVADTAAEIDDIVSESLDNETQSYVAAAADIVAANQIVNEDNIAAVAVVAETETAKQAIMDQSLADYLNSTKLFLEAAQIKAEDTIQSEIDETEGVLDASDLQVEGLTADINEMTKNTAEGWGNIQDVTKTGVTGTANTLADLDAPMSAVGNAPGSILPSWSSGWQSIVDGVIQAVQGIINAVKGMLDSLGSNPLLQAVAGLDTFAIKAVGVFNPVIGQGVRMVETFNGIRTAIQSSGSAADGTSRSLAGMAGNAVPQVVRDTERLQGRLREMLDGINNRAADTQDRLSRLGQGKDTDSGNYPTKAPAGGGGGKGKGGGAGKGPGVGPEAAYNRAVDQAEELSQDLSEKIQKAGQQALEKLEDINTKAEAAMLIEAREYQEKRSAIITKANEDTATTLENFNQSRADRTLRKSLTDQLNLETQTRGFEKQARDYRISDAREAEDRQQSIINRAMEQGLSQQQDVAARGYKRLREDEDTAYKRQEDDTETHLRKLEDLAAKHTERQTQAQQDAIRGGITLGFSKAVLSADELEKRRLARARANEDKDTARSRTREDEDIQVGLAAQMDAQRIKDSIENNNYGASVRRRTEDRNRQHQDVLDDATFTEHQAQVRQSLEDNIEVAGINRRLVKIDQDRIDRLAILDREHKEREDKIRVAADNESKAVLGTLNNQLQDVQAYYTRQGTRDNQDWWRSDATYYGCNRS
jgi:TP901 family phage tail tape measure protein